MTNKPFSGVLYGECAIRGGRFIASVPDIAPDAGRSTACLQV
jgi:hypothetical protein